MTPVKELEIKKVEAPGGVLPDSAPTPLEPPALMDMRCRGYSPARQYLLDRPHS